MSRQLLSIPSFGYVTGPIQGQYRVKVKTETGWRVVASRKLAEQAEELLQGLWLSHKQGALRPSSKSATIREAAEGYLRDRIDLRELEALSAGMLAIDHSAVARITARWPHQKLRSLGPDDIRAWWIDLQTLPRALDNPRALTARSAEHYVKTLSRVYQWAQHEKGWTTHNPVPPKLTAGALEAKPGEELTEAEVSALIANCREHHQPLVRFLSVTGARIGEACSMTVSAVHLDRGEVLIPTAKRRDRGKLTRRPRPIAISDPVMLAELETLTAGRAPGDPLFTGIRGGAVDPHTFRDRYWKPAARAAGVPEAVPHWLRHTVATRLARGGLTAFELKDWLGWSSIDQAETYVKAAQTGLRRGADLLSSVA